MDLLNKLRNNVAKRFSAKRNRDTDCSRNNVFPGKIERSKREFILRACVSLFSNYQFSRQKTKNNKEKNEISNDKIIPFKFIPRPIESRLNENRITTEKLFILRSISIFQSPVRAYPRHTVQSPNARKFQFPVSFHAVSTTVSNTAYIYIFIYVREKKT